MDSERLTLVRFRLCYTWWVERMGNFLQGVCQWTYWVSSYLTFCGLSRILRLKTPGRFWFVWICFIRLHFSCMCMWIFYQMEFQLVNLYTFVLLVHSLSSCSRAWHSLGRFLPHSMPIPQANARCSHLVWGAGEARAMRMTHRSHRLIWLVRQHVNLTVPIPEDWHVKYVNTYTQSIPI